MRRTLLVFLIAGALSVGAPASAHHVETSRGLSDSEALGVYVSEYRSQRDPIVPLAAEQALRPSPSGQAEVRNAIDVTILHMESLEVRACFSTVADLVAADLEALARSLHSDADPLMAQSWRAVSNHFYGLVAGEVSVAVLECAPEVEIV